jgi:hypothetical protein
MIADPPFFCRACASTAMAPPPTHHRASEQGMAANAKALSSALPPTPLSRPRANASEQAPLSAPPPTRHRASKQVPSSAPPPTRCCIHKRVPPLAPPPTRHRTSEQGIAANAKAPLSALPPTPLSRLRASTIVCPAADSYSRERASTPGRPCR